MPHRRLHLLVEAHARHARHRHPLGRHPLVRQPLPRPGHRAAEARARHRRAARHRRRDRHRPRQGVQRAGRRGVPVRGGGAARGRPLRAPGAVQLRADELHQVLDDYPVCDWVLLCRGAGEPRGDHAGGRADDVLCGADCVSVARGVGAAVVGGGQGDGGGAAVEEAGGRWDG